MHKYSRNNGKGKSIFRIDEPKNPTERKRAQQYLHNMGMVHKNKFVKNSIMCENHYCWKPATWIRMRLQHKRFSGMRQSPAGVLKIKQNSRDWHRCFSLNFAKFIRAQMSTSDRKGLCWTIFLINCSLSAWNFMKQGRLMQVFSFELLNY